MRKRPEPTQLEDLSDASFLGKLLVLLANVRLDWKVFARHKHSSLFGPVIGNREKKFFQHRHLFSVGGLLGEVRDDVSSGEGLELEHEHLARLESVHQVHLKQPKK